MTTLNTNVSSRATWSANVVSITVISQIFKNSLRHSVFMSSIPIMWWYAKSVNQLYITSSASLFSITHTSHSSSSGASVASLFVSTTSWFSPPDSNLSLVRGLGLHGLYSKAVVLVFWLFCLWKSSCDLVMLYLVGGHVFLNSVVCGCSCSGCPRSIVISAIT